MSRLTHFDDKGRANMVDVSGKNTSSRMARASGFVKMQEKTLLIVKQGQAKKGDVITIAELAGIMGAKQTSNLIPLCHNLPISGVRINIEPDEKLPGLRVEAEVKTSGRTGVEMEALSAVSIACLSVYDMLKAVDKDMIIGEIKLLEKLGGKSGHYKRGA